MVDFMKGLPDQLKRPDAILVISAHWEEHVATVLTAPQPPLLYDYYGFLREPMTLLILRPAALNWRKSRAID